MEVKMDFQPCFMIDDERLQNLCKSTARNNNDLAKSVGQSERLSSTELMDLYYAQGGRCALTGFPLEYHESLKNYRRIQLDHITERRARAVVANAVSGVGPTEYGKIACITNVQWVCRFANMIKEYVRSAGINYGEAVRAMAFHLEEGFLLRSQASHLGIKGKREFRESVVKKMISENQNVTAVAVLDALRGTPGESCYAVVINTMKECGWDSRYEIAFVDQRKAIIADVVKSHGTFWPTVKKFAEVVNLEFAESGICQLVNLDWIKNEGLAMGVTFKRLRRRQRTCTNGDKKAFVDWLRSFKSSGASAEQCVDFFEKRGVFADQVSSALNGVIDSGAVYESKEGMKFFASLLREQAAEIIGVSPNRLKKWACHSRDFLSGPSFLKKSEKGRAYYTWEDVQSFASVRQSHKLDLSACGQREECVVGGHKGGRPTG